MFRKHCTIYFYSLPIYLLNVLLDSLFYGYPTITIWNFIRFNVLENKSANYGTSKSTAYLTFMLPQILTLLYPIGLFCLLKDFYTSLQSKTYPYLSSMIVTHVFVVSMIPHKEPRFCLVIVPLVVMQVGKWAA